MTLCANQDETGLEHRQVAILDAAQEVFTVDENIQPLIQLLYDNEICTFNSCEDNQGGRIWIEFGLFDWLAIVEEAYKLYRHSGHAFYDFVLVDCEVKLQPEDDGRLSESNPDIWIEGDEVVWSASVRFPKEQVQAFEAMIGEVVQVNSLGAKLRSSDLVMAATTDKAVS